MREGQKNCTRSAHLPSKPGKKVCMLKGCNFIAPQALIQQLYYQYFILLLNYRAIFDTSAKWSEAHMLKGCIKNFSIDKLYNKVLQLTKCLYSWLYYLPSNAEVNVFKKKFFTSSELLLRSKIFEKTLNSAYEDKNSPKFHICGDFTALSCLHFTMPFWHFAAQPSSNDPPTNRFWYLKQVKICRIIMCELDLVFWQYSKLYMSSVGLLSIVFWPRVNARGH